MKERLSVRIVRVQTVSSLGERHSQQILILLNDTHALTHSLEVLLMSLVCGYGVEPDWLHAQTDGSSVRCHHFLLCSLRLILRKQHVTVCCRYQSGRRLTLRALFQCRRKVDSDMIS